MADQGDDRIKAATFFTTMTDFAEPGELGVFIDEEQLDLIEKHMQEKGYLEAQHMQQVFNLMRANDLIWGFVVNNYLMGREPMAFDLLYWNADSTRMPLHDAQLLPAQHVPEEPAGAARRHHAQGRADRPRQDQDALLLPVDQGGPYRTLGLDLSRQPELRRAGPLRARRLRPHRRRDQPALLDQVRLLDQCQAPAHAGGLAGRGRAESRLLVARLVATGWARRPDPWFRRAIPGEGGLPALEPAPGSFVKVRAAD